MVHVALWMSPILRTWPQLWEVGDLAIFRRALGDPYKRNKHYAGFAVVNETTDRQTQGVSAVRSLGHQMSNEIIRLSCIRMPSQSGSKLVL